MSAQGKTFIRRRGTTAVPNSTVHDSRISLQALGILVVVLGRPASKAGNGYRSFMGRGMGQAAVLKALKDLEDAGYRYQFTRRTDGRVVTDTVWSETPIDPMTAAAWHAQEVEAHESRGKSAKVRKLKAGTVRENPRTDRAWKSTHGTVRDFLSVETHAPVLRTVQGSPTHYVRNGEPETSNAHEGNAENDTSQTAQHAPTATVPPVPSSTPTEGQEDATPAHRPSVPSLAHAQGQEVPQSPPDAERPADGPTGVQAWHEVKQRLQAQREERRARQAAEARVGRLTEPPTRLHPRPMTGARA